jgi:proline racemase
LRPEVEGLGEVVVDVAYGGNFYAIVEPATRVPRHGRLLGRATRSSWAAPCATP